MERIGVLTGGGDCPGLNAAIRAVVRKAHQLNYEVVGLKRGWRGLQDNETVPLDLQAVSGILPRGGTILGSSRTNPYKSTSDTQRAQENFRQLGLKALVAIGGEDTLGVAAKLTQDGYPVVGVPKTIDADIWGTEVTIGFDTAVNIATDAIDRLHSTAESHDRIMIVEIMGRHAGWLALRSGLAGGADLILIPEVPTTMDAIRETMIKRHNRGKHFSIIVVSEGANVDFGDRNAEDVLKNSELDEFGHVALGGVSNLLAANLKKTTEFDTRVTTLGHLQRGGSPSAFDRFIASHLGVLAVELVHGNRFGRLAAQVDGRFTDVDLTEVLGKLRLVPEREYQVAEVFFG